MDFVSGDNGQCDCAVLRRSMINAESGCRMRVNCDRDWFYDVFAVCGAFLPPSPLPSPGFGREREAVVAYPLASLGISVMGTDKNIGANNRKKKS